MNNSEFLNQLVERFQPAAVKDPSQPPGQQYFVQAGWQDSDTGVVYLYSAPYPYYWSRWLADRVVSLVLVNDIAAARPELGERERAEIRKAGEWLNKKIPRGEM